MEERVRGFDKLKFFPLETGIIWSSHTGLKGRFSTFFKEQA